MYLVISTYLVIFGTRVPECAHTEKKYIEPLSMRCLFISRCNIFTYDSRYCVYCLMSVCYEICVAMCKIFRGQSGDCIFTKKPIKSTKTHFF